MRINSDFQKQIYHRVKGICEEDTVRVSAVFPVSMPSDRRYASDFELMMDLQDSDFEITDMYFANLGSQCILLCHPIE